jgi:hypothetical protein
MLTMTTRSARITGPVPYRTADGHAHDIPLGPCLVERLDDRSIDIIWGPQGQRCAALPLEDVESARQQGHLLLLD